MALTFTGQYRFNYDTPTQQDDGTGTGTMVTVNVPTSFTLGGISVEVAKSIRRGLTQFAPSITNVVASRIMQDTQDVPTT